MDPKDRELAVSTVGTVGAWASTVALVEVGAFYFAWAIKDVSIAGAFAIAVAVPLGIMLATGAMLFILKFLDAEDTSFFRGVGDHIGSIMITCVSALAAVAIAWGVFFAANTFAADIAMMGAIAAFVAPTFIDAAYTFSKENDLPYRWSRPILGAEALTVYGALTVHAATWYVAIAAASVVLIFILTILAPEERAVDRRNRAHRSRNAH